MPTLIDLRQLNLLVGSGGVLSHAPRRVQSALMMLDAFLPEGITELAVDSIFMMPQLGVLSTVHPIAASQVFEKDCLIRFGSSVAPVGPGKEGQTALKVSLSSMISTARANLSVGPPYDVGIYRTGSHRLEEFRVPADSPALARLQRFWADRLVDSFDQLPPISPSDFVPVDLDG